MSSSPDTQSPVETEDRECRVTILTARADDYKGLVEDTDPTRKLSQNHPFYVLRRDQYQIRFSHVGVGKEQAIKNLDKIRSNLKADLYLLAGTAGALHDDLEPGMFFVPTAVTRPDLDDWHYPDPDILEWMTDSLVHFLETSTKPHKTARAGPLLTADEPILDADQRQQSNEQHQCLAVDMETYTMVDYIDDLHTDEEPLWAGIRTISDDSSTESSGEAIEAQTSASRALSDVLQPLVDSFV